jgi:sugar lactone lactonase YvrE
MFLLTLCYALTLLIGGSLLYLLLWPNGVEPVKWQAPVPPSLSDGPYRVNAILTHLQRLDYIGSTGPEGVSVDAQGRLYAGYADGKIARFDADGRGHTVLAETGGRPLGTAPLPDGSVVAADARKGVLHIDVNGGVHVLTTAADGLAFAFLNDVDVDPTGSDIYFSDSSSKWGTGRDIEDIIEHAGRGRLMRYEFATGRTSVILSGLQFANGVAVGLNGDCVLVAETGAYRVMRHWLRGPNVGRTDVFVEDLPGFPDNISFNGRDRYWLAIAAPRHPLIDKLAGKPFLRKVISRIPSSIQPKPKRHSIVLGLDLEGRVIANAHAVGKDAYWKITSACESGPWLYCGSVDEAVIARLPLNMVV